MDMGGTTCPVRLAGGHTPELSAWAKDFLEGKETANG
jgi:hypothetical protein